MPQKTNNWIRLLPPLLLLPLVIVPPIAGGSLYWGAGLLVLCGSVLRIVLFLIRVLWELADKKEADPDMREILRSMLTVGVMILAFCSLAAGRYSAREQALMIAARVQADCGFYGNCPESLLPQHLKEGRRESVGAWMRFPLRYHSSRELAVFLLDLTLSYRDHFIIEGGVGKDMKWYTHRK